MSRLRTTAGGDALAGLIDRFVRLPLAEREALAAALPEPVRRTLSEYWAVFGHEGQVEPPDGWRIWAIVAGRGFGKTRAGAEWVSAIARADRAVGGFPRVAGAAERVA